MAPNRSFVEKKRRLTSTPAYDRGLQNRLMKLSESPFLQSPRTVAWRRWTFNVHLWLALLLGPVLAVVCLTGSIVVFRYELNRLTVPGTAYVTPR